MGYNGKIEVIMALLDKGADIHARDEYQNTPLHRACMNGNIEVIMALLDRGADIHARKKDQNTPLHVACYHGNIEVIMALLDRGADILAIDKYQQKPYDYIENSNTKSLFDQFVGAMGPVGTNSALRDL